MRLNKLRKKLRRQIRREKLVGKERKAVEAVLQDKPSLVSLNERIEAEVNPWNQDGLIGDDRSWRQFLSDLWDWFVANWPKILEIILTIAPLLMEPPHEDS